MALAGGLVGCVLGCLTNGRTALGNVSSDQGVGRTVVFTLVVDSGTVTLGLLFTLAMGLIGGLLPAWTATRLRPLEAWR